MALHWLVPKDERMQSWVFYENGSSGLHLLPEVAEMPANAARSLMS